MKRLRSKLTYANVMATVAVFVALGGASYAAVKLPKNSVGSKQIKVNAVTEAKIKDGAVTGAKIAAGTITGANVNASTLGTVPKATSAQSATEATTAATATTATTATTANTAKNATHAASADRATEAGFAEDAEFAAGAGSPEELLSGETERGFYGMRGAGTSTQAQGLSFTFRLPSAPAATHVIELGEAVPSGCSGNEANPGAAPGNLCVFEGFEFNRTDLFVCAATGCQTRDGVMLIGEGNSGLWDSSGSWAVTAP
jgi:hypothetical protein